MNTVWLKVLGLVIRVDCLYESCAMGITEHMSGHICNSQQRQSPDLWLEITSESFDRYFHRERPEELSETELAGVFYYVPRSTKRRAWTSHLPPLVPFHHEVNKHRFVALHAGCVELESGEVVLFAGARGAGKTTLARHLCNQNNGILLTDEALFIHRRSTVVEPLTLAMGVFSDGPENPKTIRPASELCSKLQTSARLLTHLVLLKARQETSYVNPLSSSEIFSGLMTHQISVGSEWNEVVSTFVQLSNDLPAHVLGWKDYGDIPRLVESLLSAIKP